MSRHTGPAGSWRADSSSFAAIASSCCISVRVRSTDTLATPTWGLLPSILFILTSYETPRRRLRFLAGDSQTNRTLGLFRPQFQPNLDQGGDSVGKTRPIILPSNPSAAPRTDLTAEEPSRDRIIARGPMIDETCDCPF